MRGTFAWNRFGEKREKPASEAGFGCDLLVCTMRLYNIYIYSNHCNVSYHVELFLAPYFKD